LYLGKVEIRCSFGIFLGFGVTKNYSEQIKELVIVAKNIFHKGKQKITRKSLNRAKNISRVM